MSVDKSAELKTMLFKEFPAVTHEFYALVVTDKVEKKVSESTIIFRWVSTVRLLSNFVWLLKIYVMLSFVSLDRPLKIETIVLMVSRFKK